MGFHYWFGVYTWFGICFAITLLIMSPLVDYSYYGSNWSSFMACNFHCYDLL